MFKNTTHDFVLRRLDTKVKCISLTRKLTHALRLPFIILLSSALIGYSCKDDSVTSKSAQLTAVNVGVTDVWLHITVSSAQQTLSIKRGDDITLVNLYTPIDTFILDEGLLPKHTYTYKVGSGEPLTITTMDTTSQLFSFQIDTLGDGASSVLNDVAIINDSCVYAVGELYYKDSSGQFQSVPYNVGRWNGNKWKWETVTYVPVRAIFAFSDMDIWAGTSAPYHWDGTRWKSYNVTGIFNGYINKIWGTNSSNLCLIGTNGSISNYDGITWRKIVSGTNVSINDIFGRENAQSTNRLIYCAASNVATLGEQKILHINMSNQIDTIPWKTGRRVSSIWFPDTLRLFTAGGGVFQRKPNMRWVEVTEIPLYYTRRIRGCALNDIVVVGDFGLVAHYNGMNWRVYPEAAAADVFYSCDYKDNYFVAVGYRGARAIILRGYKP